MRKELKNIFSKEVKKEGKVKKDIEAKSKKAKS
jgi:hypothetical protein